MYLKSNVVWKAYTEEKQTIHELSLRYKVSESTIKRLLKNVSVEWHNPKIGGHALVCYVYKRVFALSHLHI